MDYKVKKEFISFLIKSKVLMFGEFITKSNRKTPYFINTGNFKYGEQLKKLGEFYSDFIVKSNVKFDALFGPAYKGIVLVVACSLYLNLKHNLNKPFLFNRKEKKDHGEGGNFVGYTPNSGEKIAIVEDVLTAGTAVRESLPLLKNSYDVECFDMFVLVDRCEKGKNSNVKASVELKKEFNLNVNSLVTIKDIMDFLKNNSDYEKHIKNMQSYIENNCIF